MRRTWSRLLGRDCDHGHTLVVTAVGVRRTVCRQCRHVSFTMITPQRTTFGQARELRRASGL